ncbi:Abscisic acid 8'-hydroxylase 4 [Heracleum sosnowskyi]|uniref:(+)-abscisic acid 8'-hydroxylase n=1 Tax=Heracleum sosnowskyi TaxID=360622 RepID=A0AAD8I030_9APIA|nr:Abscisic acid 8'-hydroxylase 4 [Heracleum sosnowskyi]
MEFLCTGIYITFFFCTLLLHYLIKKAKIEQKHKAKLPPGSMGLPYFGETLQFYSQDPNVLFATKQKRYGDVFKTHILGCPCVMVASPEAARFVLVTHANLFKPTYPKSKEKLIGPSALFFHQGKYHTHLRKLVQSSLSPEAIRKLIPDIEVTAITTLDSCVKAPVTNTFQEMKKFSFEVGILSIFSQLDSSYKTELKKNYCIVNKGYNSFPTRFPGTAYQKARKARERINHILSTIISERKRTKLLQKDLLGHLLDFKYDNGQTLTEDQIADNIIGVLFAAQDTTASVITWILKYLHHDRELLQAVKDEQKSIFELNNGGKLPLTWAQTRNMPKTLGVILESLRMASIISYTFREAVADVEYNGYLIPKGWKVMPLFRNIHHNSEFFSDPQKFDSSRYKVAPKPNTYMPFGNGVHACPGNELAKLEILILIHHLVTKYRWDVVDSNNMIQYSPFPVPLHGLPARFRKDETQSVATEPSSNRP